jgi:flagellar biosynthesis protein FlhG
VAEIQTDQAAGLRRLFSRRQAQIVSFAAAGAGVGKTTLVANLAASLARAGKEVLVIDESAKSGVAAYFGASSRSDLLQVVNREKMLADVMTAVAPGVRVLPAARAVARLGKLNPRQQQALVECLTTSEEPADVVLVDTSLDHPLHFSPLALAAHETVIVVSPSSESITEAYALIKKVRLAYARENFRILVSRVSGLHEGRAIYRNFAEVTRSRGIARLEFAGCVPNDPQVAQARRLRQATIELYPEAQAAKAYRAIAGQLPNWPRAAGTGIEQFVQQLLHLSQYPDAEPVALYA